MIKCALLSLSSLSEVAASVVLPFALLLGLLVSFPASAQTVVADSASEFSGTQGQDDWSYGEYAAFSSASFSQLPSFTGSVWIGFQTFNTPSLDSAGGSPGFDDLHWAVRRWNSDVSGEVEISGTTFDRDTSCGDGAHVRIVRNGTEIFQYFDVPGTSTPYSLFTNVAAGDAIDFAIDPKLDGACDSTELTATITLQPSTVPSVSRWGLVALTLLLMALSGNASRPRREC